VSQSVALPAFRDRSGAGGVSVVKAPLSGGQSRTPGWRSHERARLAFGMEAGRVGAGGSAWVRGKLCMAVGRRDCPSRQLRRRSTSWSSSVSDYTSSTLAPSRWKQIDWRLCTGNVNLLKLGGRPARPLSTFGPAGRLLCSCRSALLSPFGGTATERPLDVQSRDARPPLSPSACRVHARRSRDRRARSRGRPAFSQSHQQAQRSPNPEQRLGHRR
jgi:hypothetical protein